MKRTLKVVATSFLCLASLAFLSVTMKAQTTQGQASPPTDQSKSPTYEQTVSWITDAISKAGNPNGNKITNDNVGTNTETAKYSIQFDSCNSFTIVFSDTDSETYTPEYARLNPSAVTHISVTATFKFDPRHVTFNTDKQSVWIAALDGIGHWHFHSQGDEITTQDREGNLNQSTINKEFQESGGTALLVPDKNGGYAHLCPGTAIGYGWPGTKDLPPHVVKAFQHLVDICKEHPEQAPKSMF